MDNTNAPQQPNMYTPHDPRVIEEIKSQMVTKTKSLMDSPQALYGALCIISDLVAECEHCKDMVETTSGVDIVVSKLMEIQFFEFVEASNQ